MEGGSEVVRVRIRASAGMHEHSGWLELRNPFVARKMTHVAQATFIVFLSYFFFVHSGWARAEAVQAA